MLVKSFSGHLQGWLGRCLCPVRADVKENVKVLPKKMFFIKLETMTLVKMCDYKYSGTPHERPPSFTTTRFLRPFFH